MTAHSPTPWNVDHDEQRWLHDSGGDVVSIVQSRAVGNVPLDGANADRIVACVNACAEIDYPHQLPGAINLLRAIAMGIRSGDSMTAILALSTMAVGPGPMRPGGAVGPKRLPGAPGYVDGLFTQLVVLRVLPEHRGHRGIYWRPGGNGYTFELGDAGLFDPDELPHSDKAEPVHPVQARKDHERMLIAGGAP